MQTKTDKVRAAIAACDDWYVNRNRDIRTLTERTEAMWYEVDYHVERMALAEKTGHEDTVEYHIDRITDYLLRIQTEAQEARPGAATS